jgi:hypothetical protein
MIGPSSTAQRELQWVYPSRADGAFVLRAGESEIGSLNFKKEVGARSAAEYEGRRWTLEHAEGRHPRVTVRAADSGEVVAEFVPHLTGGGVVAFTSGAQFSWIKLHVWSDRWCFRCKQNRSAVCVSQEAGRLTSGGKVAICSDAAPLPETAVLLLLGWYLRLLEFERLENEIMVCA